MNIIKSFRKKARTGKIRVWEIEVDGRFIHTRFGDEGGKMQEVTDEGESKNVGRSNEISPEEDARNKADKMILAKTRGGYREAGEEEEADTDIDFSSLPQNLCFYKPTNTMSKALEKKLEDGKAWLSRKRDGEMMVIVIDHGRADIYSRKMLYAHHLEEDTPWWWRFPHICVEIEGLDIPDKTILLGEMVAGPSTDDRWHVASCLKTKTRESLERQDEKGRLYYYCWDVAFFGGEDWVSKRPLTERYALISNLFDSTRYLLPVEWYSTNDVLDILDAYDSAHEVEVSRDGTAKSDAMVLAAASGWEGFVVVDPDGVYGDKAYNFRGKPDRPGKVCGKLKPVYEDDFVAMWDPDEGVGAYGSGKYRGLLGSVELCQYNSAGELRKISDMGNGWTKKFIEDNSSTDDWPKVLQVKYDSRTYTAAGDKTNALQFPRFMSERVDKAFEECINEKLG